MESSQFQDRTECRESGAHFIVILTFSDFYKVAWGLVVS